MATPLATYVHDHLAGAGFATDLLETLRDQHPGETVGNFAAAMLVEVETDRTVLKRLADRVGSGSSPIKEAAAWPSLVPHNYEPSGRLNRESTCC